VSTNQRTIIALSLASLVCCYRACTSYTAWSWQLISRHNSILRILYIFVWCSCTFNLLWNCASKIVYVVCIYIVILLPDVEAQEDESNPVLLEEIANARHERGLRKVLFTWDRMLIYSRAIRMRQRCESSRDTCANRQRYLCKSRERSWRVVGGRVKRELRMKMTCSALLAGEERDWE
jgi:hypothetical protein